MTENIQLLDAAGSVFFQKELEQVKAKSYDVLYPELTYNTAFDVSNEINPGAQEIVYETYDRRGQAKIVQGPANDIPRADVDGKESRIPVRTLASMFGYTVDEIEAARFAGKPLEQRRANAARKAIEEKMNYLTWFGDADSGLIGFFTTSLIDSAQAAATGTGSSRAWADKTGALIEADVNGVLSTIFENSEGVERPNRVGLPLTQWNLIMTKNMGTGTDTTVAKYIVQNSPFLTSVDQIIPIPELDSANNPTKSVDCMIVWTKSPDKVQVEIPQDTMFMPVQQVGLEYQTIARARFGGLNYYYPKSAYVLTDI